MIHVRVSLLTLFVTTSSSLADVRGNWEHRDDFVEHVGLPDAHHDVVIAVKQRNLAALEKITLAVSDPSHPSYGQHLGHDQVHQMTANPAAAEAVRAWCETHGLMLAAASSHDEYLTVTAPFSIWNRLLRSKFITMRHVETGHQVQRSREFTMPAGLEAHVSHIFNVVELPLRTGPGPQVLHLTGTESRRREPWEDLPYPYPCKSTMKLACWNYRYNQTSNDASGQSQMVFGQKGAYMAPDDIALWGGSNGVSLDKQDFQCPNGGCSTTACKGYDPDMRSNGHLCVEGNMDAQFISGIGQGANNTFYLNTNLDTPFLEFITHISSMATPPGSVSISYGSYEHEMDHAVMDHFATEAMKLGAQGVSILSASGDDGVAGYRARNDTSKCRYTATFPSSCPWVTSVGGTQNAENDPDDHEVHTLQEYAANAVEQQGPYFKVTTQGGFSDYFGVPPYQAAAVRAYFATAASRRAAPGYNLTGRGFPDIASNAINFQTFINSSPALVCGTSGSAPSVAGMVSAANAARARQGKSRLGFLNPLLYARPQILNDISHGWNNCTAVVGFCCKQGFTGASGWDPLVGLGSPSYVRLLKESGAEAPNSDSLRVLV
ncbi:unnamed protein product [Prorocentrum cordatum]|uniref:subtilisin n=1 Tax=Prorocentrum cordatum TaxID=2364126 RepID=A0ABN9Y2K4_9DINO|nr:unnamed protein product [Polarella glacialis]|mmetsp:Transcript_89771/g.254012  ORF Transcript_89771/g.254012 Transcript_89771/m.254012 type:complete len:605 (+) Transcript_89771:58-1872(+)